MSDMPLVPATIDLDAELVTLADRYRAADSLGLQLLNMINKPADSLLERLPRKARENLETLTIRGLEAGMSAASGTRVVVRDQADWVNTATTTAAGLVGGFGGLPTALAELPVTVTLLMRAVQGIAAEHGFDPDDLQTRKDTLLVFAASGPLVSDARIDMNFLASRTTLNGVNVYVSIGLIAPKLAAVLGRKLATQTVPVLGAGVAAATNYTYTSYYQQMAHVVFGLRRLAETTGTPFADLVERLETELRERDVLSKSA
ncbi:EcsC family protein [Cognatishimia sp. F0-27]|uniref:EcsC family protein n=1 Tax=Cognatishimia sp. F0-27 TaxID=2816855 RepID=UPI001D0CBA46|nr:EcsC family protein [Cognatishimia sp. F0-27]MCC1494882.1 EcsC family protein [Cognatishimia sp. F0-27]